MKLVVLTPHTITDVVQADSPDDFAEVFEYFVRHKHGDVEFVVDCPGVWDNASWPHVNAPAALARPGADTEGQSFDVPPA